MSETFAVKSLSAGLMLITGTFWEERRKQLVAGSPTRCGKFLDSLSLSAAERCFI